MPYIITDQCSECGSCKDQCPVDAIAEGSPYTINQEICSECGACVDTCPIGAIEEK